MDAVELEAGFAARAPWTCQFTIRGKSLGGTINLIDHDNRVSLFFDAFPTMRTVLELGSLEGCHTVALARKVDSVLAIEGRAENIRRAEFIRDIYGVDNVRFVHDNLETATLRDYGAFDAVFASGVLYHLPEPWRLLQEIATVTRQLFLWTHYAARKEVKLGGYWGCYFGEAGIQSPTSGMSKRSFWPTFDELIRMLGKSGFNKTRVIEKNPLHPAGPCVSLAASC